MACETDCDATETGFNGATASARRSHLTWGSRPGLPGAVDAVFEAGQLLGAHGAAGMKFSGGDADFRAEAEFATVGELGRCIMQHDRRIDLVEEFAGGVRVFGHDRVGMMRTVIVNMRDRLVEPVDDFRG